MASRKPRLSRMAEMQKQRFRRGIEGHAIPHPGKFRRSYHSGPEPSLRGQVTEPGSLSRLYEEHVVPARVRVARNTGLPPKAYDGLRRDLVELAERYHTMPRDEKGEPLLRTSRETGEVEIVGVKRLRGKPSYYHDIKRWGSEIIRLRAAMREMVKNNPGIDILRQLEEHQKLSNKQIVRLARSKLFTLPKKEVRKLIDEFEKLELAEHALMERIQDATAVVRSPRRK